MIELNSDDIKIELQDRLDYVLKSSDSIQVFVKVLAPSSSSKSLDKKLVEIQSLNIERTKMCGLTRIGGCVCSTENKGMKKILRGSVYIGCATFQIDLS